MHRIGIVIFLLLNFVVASAQQRPQYTQYIFNNYILNPAISGIENYTDVKLSYRNQWVGIDDGPATASFSVHAPLGKNFLRENANSSDGKGSHPMSRSFVQSYKAADPHHGIGLNLVSDRTGPITRLDLNITYAYHLGLSEKLNLAVGLAGGISKEDLDLSRITLETDIDPAVTGGGQSNLKPNLGFGVWVYSARYFGGLAVQQLLGQPVVFTEVQTGNEGKQVPHYFLTGGYKVFLSDEIAAIPSIMVKHVAPAPLSVDVNLKVAFRDRVWVGGSYRKRDSFAGMAGFNVNHLFNLSYAYDFTTSTLRTVSDGTHEIVLGILLNNRYKVSCPQRNW